MLLYINHELKVLKFAFSLPSIIEDLCLQRFFHRLAESESVRFQATKDMLDRAGLNPINKNQTESAKYISIESRFSRDALARYEKELQNEEAGE